MLKTPRGVDLGDKRQFIAIQWSFIGYKLICLNPSQLMYIISQCMIYYLALNQLFDFQKQNIRKFSLQQLAALHLWADLKYEKIGGTKNFWFKTLTQLSVAKHDIRSPKSASVSNAKKGKGNAITTIFDIWQHNIRSLLVSRISIQLHEVMPRQATSGCNENRKVNLLSTEFDVWQQL